MIYYHKLTVFSHSVKPLSSTPRCALRRGRNAYFKTNDTTNKAYEVLVVGTKLDGVTFATEHILEVGGTS